MKTKQFFASALDLLNNSKTAVLLQPPLCCAFLQNLKWLDLKDNPLDPVLAKVAGDCLDEKQCKQAAVKVRSLLLFYFFFPFMALPLVLPLLSKLGSCCRSLEFLQAVRCRSTALTPLLLCLWRANTCLRRMLLH